MKKYILIMVCLMAILGVAWAAGQSHPGKSKSITFNGKTFYLSYSVNDSSVGQWLNEYLPTGSNFNNYTDMFAVRFYENSKSTPRQLAASMVAIYTKQYPGVKSVLSVDEETGDGFVSYIMIEGNILEHNTYRTTTKDRTLISLQYVHRKYCSQQEDRQKCMQSFAQEVRNHRAEWVNALKNMSVPTVVRAAKS